jgi:transposase
MRGEDKGTGELFSYVDLEKRVRSDHPLRAIRGLVNEALVDEFSALYAPIGRPSIPPEKLLRAMLLQAFYSIRSERQLMERLEYDPAGSSGSGSMLQCGTIQFSQRTATGCPKEISPRGSWRRFWISRG